MNAPSAAFDVKVVPGASRSRIAGFHGDAAPGGVPAVRVQVAAPPEKGRANDELRRVLAEALGVHPRQVTVVRGAASPRKSVRVDGLSPEDVRARLRVPSR
ncbi:MAG: hypothetical protein HMLKMBBP_00858 [Planctomycetes bacterium]|nr:hypothetical protein [Planctomycetota bacterium]